MKYIKKKYMACNKNMILNDLAIGCFYVLFN